MPQRIFSERLKDQVGNQRLRCRRIDIELDLEPIRKSHLLNTEIQLNESEFFSQFNFLPGRVLERMTQEIAKSDEHVDSGLILVVTDETHDAVQRVEQKMWMQLHPERLQLRLGQLRFESSGQKLALAILAIVFEGIKH